MAKNPSPDKREQTLKKPSNKGGLIKRMSRRLPIELLEQLRKERRAAKTAADLFERACQTGDVAALYEAVDFINSTMDGWTAAIRRVARKVRRVSPKIRSAFQDVWIQSKMLPLHVGDNRALCDAAKVLMPRYRGPAVRLFRGAAAGERRRRSYGMSWSADVSIAERFARGRQVWNGGSVLLETRAPPAAIICAVDYPKPLTEQEIARIRREHPHIHITEFHEEREYVVDRRCLNSVAVVCRYPQIERAAPPLPLRSLATKDSRAEDDAT